MIKAIQITLLLLAVAIEVIAFCGYTPDWIEYRSYVMYTHGMAFMLFGSVVIIESEKQKI